MRIGIPVQYGPFGKNSTWSFASLAKSKSYSPHCCKPNSKLGGGPKLVIKACSLLELFSPIVQLLMHLHKKATNLFCLSLLEVDDP